MTNDSKKIDLKISFSIAYLIMEAIIFVGIQASGKSTFYKERFFKSHIRINLDMLKTRHRESLLLNSCLKMGQPFVVDNTNPTKMDRKRYIVPAQEAEFQRIGYYFQSQLSTCLERNERRTDKERIPENGIRGTYSRLELPLIEEGFDELFYVTISGVGRFVVKEWKDEV